MRVPVLMREGTQRSMRITAAPVTKPLASVYQIAKAGHMVVFGDDGGSYILNKSTGEVNMLREEDGNYILDVMVPLDAQAMADAGFTRQP